MYASTLVWSIVTLIFCKCRGATGSNTEFSSETDKLNHIHKVLEVERDSYKSNITRWCDSYSKLHKRVLENRATNDYVKAENKLIVAYPNFSGMADRIIGSASIFLFGVLTDRAIQIGHREGLPSMEIPFFTPSYCSLNWVREPDPEWLQEPLKHKAAVRQYNESVLSAGEFYAVNALDDYKMQDRFINSDLNQVLGDKSGTTFIVMNRGKTIRLFENPNHKDQLTQMGLNQYNAFGLMTNSLIQPRDEIFLPIFDHLFLKMTDPDPSVLKIMIQIRVGDASISNHNHQISLDTFSTHFNCAKQIQDFAMKTMDGNGKPKYTRVLWYLLSDSLSLRKAAVERFGDDVIVTSLDSPIEHTSNENSGYGEISQSGFRNAAAEWWLGGYANYHVITQWSGYGRSAAFRAMGKDAIYTINQNKNGQFSPNEGSCEKGKHTDLYTMFYDWSGIR
jgi:hypothetical protein